MNPVYEYLDYRKYLEDSIEERRKTDPTTSYRRLGASLGLDGSNLHKVVRGRMHLPPRCQARTLEFLGLSGRSAEYFLLLVEYARERSGKARAGILERARILQDVSRRPLEERELLFYQDWWTPVIRSLLEVQEGRAVHTELAERITPAISPEEALRSIELLAEIGLIRKVGSGRWKLSEPHVTAGGERKAQAVHAYQKQVFALAADSLQRHPREERDVSTLVLPVDDASFEDIQEILRDCRRRIQKRAEAVDRPRRVMQLAMACFPVTGKKGAAR
jgi:uncharacterized protein (TIGR02147 family)